MKISKIILVILSLCMAISSFASCQSFEESVIYEELELKQTEIISCKNNSWNLTGIIDYEAAGIAEDDVVIVESFNEQIATYENGQIVVGSEYGETSLDITVGNKTALVKVKVVPYIEYLYALTEKEDANVFKTLDYYASLWLINNLGSFKDPSSVSVEEILYSEDTVNSTDGFTATYLIMEIRARNGFGGYNIEHFKVSAGGIEEVSVQTYGFSNSYQGEPLYRCGAFAVNKAIQEYIFENY